MSEDAISISSQRTIKDCSKLLSEFTERRKGLGELECSLLSFDVEKGRKIFAHDEVGTAEITVYNPTRPIRRHGKEFIFGRVEPRDNERSKVAIFERDGGEWRLVPDRPAFNLQDPFFASDIDGYYIFGGVEVEDDPDTGFLKYRTAFYRYRDCIEELIEGNKIVEPFAYGPWGMKDIRLVQFAPGRVAVFTRPQGEIGGKGKIAYIEISSLDELENAIPLASIIPNQFHEDEWGGVNELHLLKNNKIGVLGHIAHVEETKTPGVWTSSAPGVDGGAVEGAKGTVIRHYYATAFCFDPETKHASTMEILTTANDFPRVKSKRPELGSIIFSGGIERLENDMAHLYVGIGDVTAGCITIPDPFSKWEK